MLRPFVLPLTQVWICWWFWGFVGNILTGENRFTRRVTCPRGTSSSTNPTLQHGTGRYWYQNHTFRTCTMTQPNMKVTTAVRCVMCILRGHLLGNSDCVWKTNSYCVWKWWGLLVNSLWEPKATVAQLTANTATEHQTVPAQLLVGTQSARRR
jgi:hypothetical protein